MSITVIKRKIIDQLKTVSITDILFIVGFLCFMAAKCLYFQFATGLNEAPYTSGSNINMFANTIGILIIAASLIYLISGRRRLTALIILDLVLTLIIFADTVYFRYYSNAVTIPVLLQLGLVGSTMESIENLIKGWDIVYFLDFPLLIASVIMISRINRRGTKKKGYTLGKSLFAAILLASGLAMSNSIIAWTPQGWFPYDNNPVISSLGIYYFHYYDVKRYVTENIFTDRSLSDAEKNSIEAFYQARPEDGEKFSGKAKGMNVIMVQVEAFQQFMLGRKINGVDITPNLDKLVGDSLYFNNVYFQIGGGNTSDAEFLSNTSIYPLLNGSVYFRYPSNTYYSLPKKLKESGYTANVFHANNPSFWNRTEMYKSIGFDTFYSNKDYKQDDTIGWGLTDKSFFRQSLDIMEKKTPFYSFLITLSSHYPYGCFENDTSINTGKYEDTFLGNYIKAIHYVDGAIGSLVSELKARGLYDNTLLVIYGDHYGVQKDNIPQLRQFIGLKYTDTEWLKLQKIPLIIHCPGIKAQKINKIGGEIDIYPTLANLLEINPDYAMGKDLLNSSDSYAVLRSGNIVTDNFIYFADKDKFYSNSGTEIQAGKELRDKVNKLKNQLNVSDKIINKNAFKKLEKDNSYCLKSPDSGSNIRSGQ